MKVERIDALFRGSEWRRRFAAALIECQPGINPDAADEQSDTEFRRSGHIAPELAARRLAAQWDEGGNEKAAGSL